MPKPTNVIKDPRPWPFTMPELLAGLRRRTSDPGLTIIEVQERALADLRPSVGRIRGLRVICGGSTGKVEFDLVLKEPRSATRAGMAGAGLREVTFYRLMSDQVPVCIPQLWAWDQEGEWLIMDQLDALRPSEAWTAGEYNNAVDQMVLLHDRFWGLEEDLSIFTWLARPLTADLYIYLRSASDGINRILTADPPTRLTADIDLMLVLKTIIKQGEQVAKTLRKMPFTLLHGDFWPGNVCVCAKGKMVVYDWQQASIGPGILDLIALIKNSLWWFEALPVKEEVLVARYRARMAQLKNGAWKEEEWAELWDYALLWVFLTEWMPLLGEIPGPILETHYAQIEKLWLVPVRQAAARRLSFG